jgi:hypothetical protein
MSCLGIVLLTFIATTVCVTVFVLWLTCPVPPIR